MFGLTVRFELRDEAAAAGFDQLVADTVPSIERLEPGTLVYAVHRVEGAPLSRVFYELYASRAAFDAHEATEHVRHFLRVREQYVVSLRVEFLTLITAKGVELR